MRLFPIVLVVAFLITVIYFLVFRQNNDSLVPVAINLPNTDESISVDPVTVLATRNGETLPIALPDDEFEALTNEGSFMTNRAEEGYDVLYYAPEGALTVLLLAEPLSESRLAAEDYIMSRFGITANQLCELNARVITNRFVSNFFADQELGFTGCPGSIEI